MILCFVCSNHEEASDNVSKCQGLRDAIKKGLLFTIISWSVNSAAKPFSLSIFGLGRSATFRKPQVNEGYGKNPLSVVLTFFWFTCSSSQPSLPDKKLLTSVRIKVGTCLKEELWYKTEVTMYLPSLSNCKTIETTFYIFFFFRIYYITFETKFCFINIL